MKRTSKISRKGKDGSLEQEQRADQEFVAKAKGGKGVGLRRPKAQQQRTAQAAAPLGRKRRQPQSTPQGQDKAKPKPVRAPVLDTAGQTRAVALAVKVLRGRQPEQGRVKALTCSEMDAICGQVGLTPANQRQYVRAALRDAGLHPAQGAEGDARLVAVAALGRRTGKSA